nr:hypothetical protein [uncultured Sphingomonas sp.]
MATAAANPVAHKRVSRSYYTALTALMLVLGLIAFSDNLLTDVGQPSNQQPSIIIHGLFALAWMILLFVQANLVRRGKLASHRRLGPIVFAVGAGLVLSTAYLFYAGFPGFSAMSPPVLANRIMLPIFAVAIFFAWRLRHLAAWHKRLIVMGTVLTLSPILSRAMDRILGWLVPGRGEAGLDPAFLIAFAGTWTALLVSQWIYDRRILARIHPVTIGATITLYAVYAFVYSI